MKILITGPTSFSGSYFIEALCDAGHEVVTTFTRPLQTYTGIRQVRAQKAMHGTTFYEGVEFGDERFLALLERESFDVFCHHGAWTRDYNSMEFDFQSAYANNTLSMGKVCQLLAAKGCRKVIVSGSIFEEGELFSPYGLSKRLTTQTIEFYGKYCGMHVSKFVIPNPFGALDNPKLIDYICREWFAGKSPYIRTPDYIRDNIPVDLLALGFAYWVDESPDVPGHSSFYPSGYTSTMADFVGKVATEMQARLDLKCGYELGVQTDFSQPMVLLNRTPLQDLFVGWNEKRFWDDLAQHQITLQSWRSEQS